MLYTIPDSEKMFRFGKIIYKFVADQFISCALFCKTARYTHSILLISYINLMIYVLKRPNFLNCMGQKKTAISVVNPSRES